MSNNQIEDNSQENKNLSTVTNMSIQRKRLKELHEYFKNKDIIVSIKPASLQEYEVFVLEFHGLDLETLYDMRKKLNINVTSGIRLSKDYYRIVILIAAVEKGNWLKLYHKRNNNKDIHELFEKYLGSGSLEDTIMLS